MKAIILSVKFDDKKAIVSMHAPDELLKPSIKDLQEPDKSMVYNSACWMQWLKMAAQKNNQEISLFINDKPVVDRAPTNVININEVRKDEKSIN